MLKFLAKELYRTIKVIGKKALQKHNVDLIIAATAIEQQAILVSRDNKDKIFEILGQNRNDFLVVLNKVVMYNMRSNFLHKKVIL